MPAEVTPTRWDRERDPDAAVPEGSELGEAEIKRRREEYKRRLAEDSKHEGAPEGEVEMPTPAKQAELARRRDELKNRLSTEAKLEEVGDGIMKRETGMGEDVWCPTTKEEAPPERPKAVGDLREILGQPCSDEMHVQLGYPEYPEKWKDPVYLKEWWEEQSTDPEKNPNLRRDISDQEFWNEAARGEWEKVHMKHDAHWTDRRDVWLHQYVKTEEMNTSRAATMDLLEDCPVEQKKLLQPILKYKVTEFFLWNLNNESKEHKLPFKQLLMREHTQGQLHDLRRRLDAGGDGEAEGLMDELSKRAMAMGKEERQKKELAEKERGRIKFDMGGIQIALEWGQKCKKDGNLEWKKGNWEDALLGWKQGDETLKRFKVSDHYKEENNMIYELHGAILRNCSQAAIKCGKWGEALQFADDALAIPGASEHDHKAWFRKACALEGVGKLEEAQACLDKIDECSVGRPDRDRLNKEAQAKRDKLQALRDREEESAKRMLQRGLDKGIFSEEREQRLMPQEAPKSLLQPTPGHAEAKRIAQGAFKPLAVDEASRKRITRDGAWDLLQALLRAYDEPGFRQRVDKLAADVLHNPLLFIANLKGVALEVQRPVLERWGFEASPKGVQEMQKAVQDHTRGLEADVALKELGENVGRKLYGSESNGMYLQVVGGPTAAAG